jgi:sugar-specific transcriptional regulator TrmB
VPGPGHAEKNRRRDLPGGGPWVFFLYRMNTKTNTPGAVQALERLGFTELEAEVYQFLCRESPASGYRIAQALGRPVSNIYKVAESLQDKGAALTADDHGTRVLRAVPIGEVASRLRRQLAEAEAEAARVLAEPAEAAGDWALYRLADAEGALERARVMLRGARRLAVVLVTPAIAEALADDLRAAAGRVAVAVKVFRAIDIPGATVVVDGRGESAVESGPGEWLSLNTDGSAYLQALFDASGRELRMANWSANPLLAWTTYTGLTHAIRIALVREQLAAGVPAERVLAELESDLPHETSASMGKELLTQQYREAARPRRRASAGS